MRDIGISTREELALLEPDLLLDDLRSRHIDVLLSSA